MPRLQALLVALALMCCDRGSPSTASEVAPRVTPGPATTSQSPLLHEGGRWLAFDLDLNHVSLELVGQVPGEPTSLASLAAYLGPRGQRLVMATNAGIFSPTRKPMGLHIQAGRELSSLSTEDGVGNFFLKPNGVFWLDDTGPHVAATENYTPKGSVTLATQSGPLLVDRNRIHPAFDPDSTSLKHRSGVGVDRRGHVWMVLSLDAVSFHAMATLFRDRLGCPSALYLDGEISGMAAPELSSPPRVEYGGLLVATRRE